MNFPSTTIYSVHHADKAPQRPLFGSYQPINVDCGWGQHIADQESFGELRAHFHVWKNRLTEGYVGFEHYRRRLGFGFYGAQSVYDDAGLFAWHEAYSTEVQIAGDVDFIVPRPWRLNKSIAEQYCEAHSGRDWETLVDIVPEFGLAGADDNYYACNIFVARSELFDRYMGFWWDLVSELGPRLEIPCNAYQRRSLAFLSERIFSMWLRSQPELRIVEVPLLMDLLR